MSNIQQMIQNTRKSKATAEGSHEWLTERVTALFSIPLLLWLIVGLVRISCGCFGSLKDFISEPINAIAIITLFACFLVYTSLALKVVFEDYVKCNCLKWTLILGVKFISIVTFITAVFAILNIYFNL